MLFLAFSTLLKLKLVSNNIIDEPLGLNFGRIGDPGIRLKLEILGIIIDFKINGPKIQYIIIKNDPFSIKLKIDQSLP